MSLVIDNRLLKKTTVLVGAMVAILVSTAALAEITGISVSIEDYSTTWQFQSGQRTTDINQWNMNLEEKTTTGLRVGVNIGQMSIRIIDQISPTNTQKLNASSLGLYLRLPLKLNDNLSVHGRLSYRFNSGTDSNDIDPGEIVWYETGVELGFSGRWRTIRITPFVDYRSVDGDISDSGGIELFGLVDDFSSGIRLDYFVDSTAYIRLQLISGARDGGYLVFAREY